MAGPDKRIFSEITLGKYGDPSNAYSRTFSRYLKAIGIKTPKNCFHSFRHTFSDACDNFEIITPHRHSMMGHSDKSAPSQYGKGAKIKVLHEAISRIHYEFEASFQPNGGLS